MSGKFTITSANTNLSLNGKSQGEASFTISNSSQRPMRGLARVVPADGAQMGWFAMVGEAERSFPAGATQQFTVQINVPPGTEARRYSFRLDVISDDNPDENFGEGPTVAFEVKPSQAPAKPFPWWAIAAVVAAMLLVGGGVTWMLWPEETVAAKQEEEVVEMQEEKVVEKREEAPPATNKPSDAKVPITAIVACHDRYEMYFNGRYVGEWLDWRKATTHNLNMQPGKNVLAFICTDSGKDAGLLVELRLPEKRVGSNNKWKVSTRGTGGWTGVDYDDSSWPAASQYGIYGATPLDRGVVGMPIDTTAFWIWSSSSPEPRWIWSGSSVQRAYQGDHANQVYIRYSFFSD